MVLRGKYLGILVVLLLSLSFAAAIAPIAPTNNEETLNQQPLFSWTNYAGTIQDYTLILSREADMTDPWKTYVTTTPYYQLQESLSPGTWYWQTTARGETTETTPITTLTVIERPTFSIAPDLSRYDDNNRVDFLINAPLGSHVNVNITKQGFNLPFNTNNLQTDTFTTFLEPGDYVINAVFLFEGISSSYADVLHLAAPLSVKRTLTFNVTDSEIRPLEKATITLTQEEKEYTIRTSENGTATLLVDEGEYDFLIEHEDFLDDEFTERILRDELFRIRLVPEELATATTTPRLAATAIIPQPEIIIASPTYREEITALPFIIQFTATDHASIQSCDLLHRMAGQQGWILASTTDQVNKDNTIEFTKPPQGESSIKIQCSLKGYEKTVASDARTIIVSLPPEHHEQAMIFLDELQALAKKLPTSNDPLFTSMDIQGKIAEAKTTITDLDKTYIDQLTAGNKAQAETTSENIQQEIATLRKELVTSFAITDRQEIVTEADLDAVKEIIKESLSSQDFTDKQKQSIQEQIIKEQTSYTIRTKVVVAKLETMEGNQRYVTGVTRTIQQYYASDEHLQQYHVIEELPSYFLQQTGTPKILDENGDEITRVEEEKARLTLSPESSYTLLFSGNVQPSVEQLNMVLVRKYDNATRYLDETNTGGITGAVVSVLGGIGGVSPVLWVFIAIIIATFIVNPFSVITMNKKDKRVTQLTDAIHDTLDLMEQGMHEQAFANYPSIIETYEQLRPEHQNDLSFAITNLSSALHVHTTHATIQQAIAHLANLTSRAQLAHVQAITTQIITDYQELDAESRKQLKPSLQTLQEQLKEKHAFLTSPKPRKNYPIP